jgi:hypothetical protein
VIERLKPLQGMYVPAAYAVSYAADGTIEAVVSREPEVPAVIVKRRLKDVNLFETRSMLKSPKAEYGHMALLEVGKGAGEDAASASRARCTGPCGTGAWRRCASPWPRSPRSPSAWGWWELCLRLPWIGELMKMLEEYGVEVSISSLRADSLTEDLVASLQRGGHRTLTMAPEAGTERLRRVVRKVITDEQIYAACDLLRKYGMPNLKCYFMIGQPTETMGTWRPFRFGPPHARAARVPGPDGHPFGKLTLSVSSFVPKPWTPSSGRPSTSRAISRPSSR